MRFLGLVITTDRRIDRLMAFEREIGRIDGHREGIQEGVRRGMAIHPLLDIVKMSSRKKGGGRQ